MTSSILYKTQRAEEEKQQKETKKKDKRCFSRIGILSYIYIYRHTYIYISKYHGWSGRMEEYAWIFYCMSICSDYRQFRLKV